MGRGRPARGALLHPGRQGRHQRRIRAGAAVQGHRPVHGRLRQRPRHPHGPRHGGQRGRARDHRRRPARGLLARDQRREHALAERRQRRLRRRPRPDRPARGPARSDRPARRRSGARGVHPRHRRHHPDPGRRPGRRGHRPLVLDRPALAAGADHAHPRRRDRPQPRPAARRRRRQRNRRHHQRHRTAGGHRLRRRRGPAHLGLLPAGPVQAVRVHRPRHRLGSAPADIPDRRQRRHAQRSERPARPVHVRRQNQPGERRVRAGRQPLGGGGRQALRAAPGDGLRGAVRDVQRRPGPVRGRGRRRRGPRPRHPRLARTQHQHAAQPQPRQRHIDPVHRADAAAADRPADTTGGARHPLF